ncbi:hypothetical protein [Polymorphospora lycopeni]|uniref:Tape measure protein n=1 Tax=Polymorphospora lycopeni TaxID=3140240 RepID=A0ABV5CKX4_9ACTN
MTSPNVGTVAVTVVASARDFARSLRQAVTREFQRAAGAMSKAITSSLKLTGLAAAAGIGATAIAGLASSIASALPVIAALGTTVATAAGSLIALPGVAAIAAAAVGTIRLGLSGMSESFKAIDADAKTFNATLKGLSKNGKSVARQLRSYKRVFDGLGLRLQNILLRNISTTMRVLVTRFLPPLTAGMEGLAAVLNAGVNRALRGLATAANALTLRSVFTSATATVSNLNRALQPVLQAMLDLVRVGAAVTAEFSAGVAGAITSVAERISELARNGEMAQMFRDGVAAAQQLFALGGDIIGIIGGIFRAAGSADGAGIFGFFDRLNRTVNSALGQGAIKSVFEELGRIGEALTPVLLTLLRALTPLAKAISDVAIAFAPGLDQIVAALAAGISALAPAVVALAPALTAVAGAIEPFAAVLAQLIDGFTPGLIILIDGLSAALRELAYGTAGARQGMSSAGKGAEGMGSLFEAAGQIGAALGEVLAAVAPTLRTLGSILASLITGAAPGFVVLLDAISLALFHLEPVVPLVAGAFAALAKAVAPLVATLGVALAGGLTTVSVVLTQLSTVLEPLIKQFAIAFTSALSALLPTMLELGTRALPALAQAGLALAQAFEPLAPILVQIVEEMIRQLLPHLPQITAAFIAMIPSLTQLGVLFAQYLLVAFEALRPYLPLIISAFVQLTPTILELVAALLPLLPMLVTLAIVFLQVFVESGQLHRMMTLLVIALTIAIGVIRAITAVLNVLTAPFRAVSGAADTFGTTVQRSASNALSAIRGLPGQISGALGNMGNLLYQAGRNVVQGLINGIRSMFGSLGTVASSMAGTIRNYLPFSPAKTGPLSGRGNPYYSGQSIAELLAGGMDSQTPIVAAAAGRLAAQVAFPASAYSAAPSAPTASHSEYHLHNGNATLEQLRALQERQATLARIGRAR